MPEPVSLTTNPEPKQNMENENKTHYVEIVELHTFAAQEDDTYLAGVDDDGNDITIVLSTIDLLRWLDIQKMKAQAKLYIDQL